MNKKTKTLIVVIVILLIGLYTIAGTYSVIINVKEKDGVTEIINEIMSAVPGIKAEEVIYCGDSDVDMQTGINAGIKTIGVTWGFRTREELRAYAPWRLAEKPEEISAAVLTYSE